MKHQKSTIIVLGLLLMFAFVLGYSQTVWAAQKDTITKSLEYQKPLDIFLGKGGVYFPSSTYTGKAVVTRTEAENTKGLSFTHRWLDIHLFDVTCQDLTPINRGVLQDAGLIHLL